MRRHYSITPMTVLLLATAAGCDAPAGGRIADPAMAPAAAGEAARGDSLSGVELAAVFGCGACHAGAPAPEPARARAPALSDLAERWGGDALVEYLIAPRPLREGVLARMPDFHLDRVEAAAVAVHLLGEDRSATARAARAAIGDRHPAATAERGEAIVDALNCAGCHEGTGTEAWSPGPPLLSIRERVRPSWLPAYLASPSAIRPFGYHPGSGSRMPSFDLSPAEADSLASWLSGGALAGPGEVRGGGGEVDPGPASGSTETSSDERATRLLTDHMACLGCHALDGQGGRIGPALDGAGARLRSDYLRRMVHSPGRTVPGTMMPAPLQDSAMVERVAAYLEGQWGASSSEYLSLVEHRPARPDPAGGRQPAALYARYCAACHGEAGSGDGFNAAYLPAGPTAHADSSHMSTRPDDTLFDGIHGGGHILGRSHRMPGFGETLTSAEIRGLVRHLRVLCRCRQPAWAESS